MYEAIHSAEDRPGPAAGVHPGRSVLRSDAEVAPDAFLRAAGRWPRGFWQRGERWSAFAGAAAILVVSGGGGDGRETDRFRRARHRAARLLAGATGGRDAADPPRLYGGFSFTERDAGEGCWAGFPRARLVLPRLEARAGPGGTRLLARSDRGAGPPGREDLSGPGGSAAGARELLDGCLRRLEGRSLAAPEGSPPKVTEIRNPRSEEAWADSVRRVLEDVRAGSVSKVVLARSLDVELATPPDPLGLLARLRRSNPRSYAFYLEPEPGVVLLGAAPELVGALEGRSFLATAVAGTIRRGRDAAEDRELARRLLASAKDRGEHRIGVEELAERLAGLAPGARVDRVPRVVKQNRVQHLRTDLTLDLPEDAHILDLLAELHPAAAVCGHPREVALRILLEEEGFDRGWYAAPVGWFDASGNGEFAPALRSAVLRGTAARLFAGAGIVEGSDPGREWEETRLKFGPMLEVLGAATE